MSGIVDQSADARSKTIGENFRVRAWGRISDSSGPILSASGGISALSSSGDGTQCTYSITLNRPMDKSKRCITTMGYGHEGGVVEGKIEWGTGNYNDTDSVIKLIYEGNATAYPDCVGFAVFL